jgi:carbon monoxide dehydrogenase subunit G
MTTTVDTSIEVNLPVRTVYNQWTQFAEFPHFMGGVQSVTQLGDDRMHWVAEIAGVKREWDARVLEQVPDQRVAWAATEGATNAGAVTFEDLGGRTRVNLFLEYEPEGLLEKVGDKLDVVERQAKSDLERFKAFIESEGYATGAWRGTVAGQGHVGTPGVEHAAESRGDAGKAGVSGKAVATGIGVAAAAAAVAGAAMASSKKSDDEVEVPVSQPVGTPEPVVTSFDATETPATSVGGSFDATDSTATSVGAVDPVDPSPLPSGTAGVRTDGIEDDTPGRTGV